MSTRCWNVEICAGEKDCKVAGILAIRMCINLGEIQIFPQPFFLLKKFRHVFGHIYKTLNNFTPNTPNDVSAKHVRGDEVKGSPTCWRLQIAYWMLMSGQWRREITKRKKLAKPVEDKCVRVRNWSTGHFSLDQGQRTLWAYVYGVYVEWATEDMWRMCENSVGEDKVVVHTRISIVGVINHFRPSCDSACAKKKQIDWNKNEKMHL